jgi:hypothetical protein
VSSKLVPLYGFVRGDSLGVLVLCRDTDSIRDLAENLGQATSVRVEPRGVAQVYRSGRLLDPALTVAEAGLLALDRVDLVPAGGA